MENAIQNIEALIETGEEFSYQNFAKLEPQGRWASAFTPDWVSWNARLENTLSKLFDQNSAPVRMWRQGAKIELKGNGPDAFEATMGYYLGALHAAREILKEDRFGEAIEVGASAPFAKSNRVFIVHGHDEKAQSELEIILGEVGLKPVVLHRQADGGRTLIEKFEHYSDVGFAFVLLTPDEIAYLVADEKEPDNKRRKEHRARPNAIFEFGFFVGKLGRGRTCCIYKSPVSVPSDLDGLIYKKFERSVEEIAYALGKELKAAGYKLA